MTMSKIRSMRGFLASSIGVTCAAALALPLTPPVVAANARPVPAAEAEAATTIGAGTTTRAASEPYVPGSTQSLPLAPLARDRALGTPTEQGLLRPDVRRFSLVGVIWDDPDAELDGRVQVRTRAAGTDTWSEWQDLETHNSEHAADPDTDERTSGRVRGSTAPLWVGDSDGVEVRVRAEAEEAAGSVPDPLPSGLHLELVDPGTAAAEPPQHIPVGAPRVGALAAEADEALAASSVNADLAPLGATEIPAETQRSKPYVGQRPRIVTRRGWGANERLRERKFVYTKRVKAAFVHHTASGNKYRCSQAPSLIRGIYRYHVRSMGWRDIGYNFLVDRCGNIYEGRAGGVAKSVLGAHTLGFNANSMGIAVLGSFGSAKPSSAAVKAIGRLTAWKLGLFGANPRGKTYLKSGGGNRYRKGKKVRLNVISGHRDGFSTACPGWQLYRKLGSARKAAAHYQGR